MRALLARGAERGTPFKLKRAEARDALDKAIVLDPQLPTPYIALTQLEPEGAFVRRWRHVLKSLEVAPDHADSLTLAGHFSFTVGWAGDALAYGRRAYALDPLHSVFDAVERASFTQIFDDEGGHAAGHYNPGIIFNRAGNWPMMSDPRFVRLCHKLRYIDLARDWALARLRRSGSLRLQGRGPAAGWRQCLTLHLRLSEAGLRKGC